MFPPSPSLTELAQLEPTARRQALDTWVAWFNGHKHDLPKGVEQALMQQLAELDRLEAGVHGDLEHLGQLQRWLETAGRVGGPENEQDPTRPHPALWHGHDQEDL